MPPLITGPEHSGRRSGKSIAFDAQLKAALAAGYTVLVATGEGSTIRKQHRSGLILITPVTIEAKPLLSVDECQGGPHTDTPPSNRGEND